MFRTGLGIDYHVLQAGIPLILGGVLVPSERGCVAHSDGDVLLHALCDALLGALALGDIGAYFPDTNPDYRRISSLILLERTYRLIEKEGYVLGNADMMLLLEAPKIASFIGAMRLKIAQTLHCATTQISIKATTAEGLGCVGRGEGVCAHAAVLLFRKK